LLISSDCPGIQPSQDSPVGGDTKKKDEGDWFTRKAGLGNLMKSAKQDVQMAEFDINSFF